MMNKKDSLNFLQSCIDKIANASEEDIEMFRMKYDMHCMEPMISSEFEFIVCIMGLKPSPLGETFR